MPKESYGTQSHKAKGKRNRKGILWRLLTCSEKNCPEESEENWSKIDDEKLPQRASKRHRQNHVRQFEVSRRLHTTSQNLKSRQRQKSRGASTIEGTATESSPSSDVKDCCRVDGDGIDKRRQRMQRHRQRHSQHHHDSRLKPSWTSDASEVTPERKKLTKNSCGTREAWRRQKRVAMLEDRDRQVTVEPIQSSDYHGIASPENLELRKKRDNHNIKQILHQLSTTIDVSDNRARAVTAAASNQSPLASAVMTPRYQLQQQQLQLQPDSHFANRPLQLGQTLQQQSYLPRQLCEQLQAQQGQQLCQANQQLDLQPKYYGIKQFSHQPKPEPVARKTGRRGYRLFRRIFSAADNYYAVPFSPLNTIKLTKDDDQWEDLEIYVSSQNGTTAIKPKKDQRKQELPSYSGDHHSNSTRKNYEKTSGIPLLKPRLVPANSNVNNQQVKSRQSTPNPTSSVSLPRSQQEVVAYARQALQQSTQQPQQLPQQLQPELQVQLPQQLRQELHVQHQLLQELHVQQQLPQELHVQHQLPQELHVQQQLSQQLRQELKQQQESSPLIPPLPRNARARPLGIPAPGFSQTSRQQQHQQRRAEPLSPSRLLSQLCGQQPSTFTGTRASLLRSWDSPTTNLCHGTTCNNSRGAGNRCGKLNDILPPSFY